MSVISNNQLAGASGQGGSDYEISRSLRFNSGDSSYLSRTPSSAGNRKTFTFSCWLKKSGINSSNRYQLLSSYASGSVYFTLEFETEKLKVFDGSAISGGLATDGVFRDPSAWYHIVCAVDTTDGTAANRVKLYVNGVQQTLTGTQPSQNSDLGINTTTSMSVGALNTGSILHILDGYLADVHFIDGQALAPTDFGEYDSNNVWQPKAYSGTYGTNGFHLDFSDNSTNAALGYDAAGSNDWTVNNLSVASGAGNDSLLDTPTNYTASSGNNGGNYATLNPLDRQASNGTLSNGNLELTQTGAAWAMYRSTMFVSSGKWYWECTLGNNQYSTPGICTDAWSMASATNAWANEDTSMYGYYPYNGNKYNGSSGVSYATADTSASGSVIGVALDMDNGTLTFYKDGTSLGTAYTGLTGKNVSPTHWLYNQTNADLYNFGQRPFAYTPPTGYASLCTQNLPDPTIADGSTAMDVKVWSGDGSSTRTISGYNHSPDFVWIKNRSLNGWQHVLYDQIRGAGTSSVTKSLSTDSTRTEASGNDTNHGYLSGFTSDGFSLVKGSQSGGDYVNHNGNAYVGWAFDAGTSTATNNDGSIASTVRANPSAGFSIVSFDTGSASGNQSAGHGLNVTPALVIVKDRGATDHWFTWSNTFSSPTANYLRLDGTHAVATSSGVWGAGMTSSVIGLSASAIGGNNIAYCFAPVAGYSAFGSYTGNGSSDGPFVFTGFRPRWIMIKRYNTTGSWMILDAARNPENLVNHKLAANNSAEEDNNSIVGSGDKNSVDFLSNGFKLRSTNGETNGGSDSFIYAAFAEHPFKTSRAR